MTAKLTIDYFKNLAKSRNHELISVSDTETPSKGRVTIRCNTCNNDFETSAKSYKNAKKTGCKYCKSIKLQTKTSIIPEQKVMKPKKVTKITNLKELKNHLTEENNPYTLFILEKMEQILDTNEPIEKHHIIPKHAGGPDSKWNLVKLSKSDHMEAHRLRYEVYKEIGDRYVLEFRQKSENTHLYKDETYEETKRENAKKADAKRKESKTGIYAPGVSSKGGTISGTVKTEKRLYGYGSLMSLDVKKVLYEGSCWFHEKTGTIIELKGQQVLSLTELKNALIMSLPETESDCTMLMSAKHNKDVTSNISKVIRGVRQSAYGWKLINSERELD